jgi:CRP/FNR family transcriptional regulator, cyclic AMP receptor protein
VTGVEPAALTAHPFTAGLTGGQLTRLAALAVPVEFPAGRRLFDEGGRADRLWLITAGRVALDLRAPGRPGVIVETLGPGAELGLSWLTAAARWQFGAVAQLPVTAFELPSAGVVALCEADHELGYLLTRRLLATAIARLQAARVRILDLYAAPAHQPGQAP